MNTRPTAVFAGACRKRRPVSVDAVLVDVQVLVVSHLSRNYRNCYLSESLTSGRLNRYCQ